MRHFCSRVDAPALFIGEVPVRSLRIPAAAVSTQFDIQMLLQFAWSTDLFRILYFLIPVTSFHIGTAYSRIGCITLHRTVQLSPMFLHHTWEMAGYRHCIAHMFHHRAASSERDPSYLTEFCGATVKASILKAMPPLCHFPDRISASLFT